MKLFYYLHLLLFSLQTSRTISAGDCRDESGELCAEGAGKRNDHYIQHSMHRIKDPQLSLPFYTEALGLTLLDTTTLAVDTKSKFTMYFLAYEDPDNIPIDDKERQAWAMSLPGAINLQHISDSEYDSNLQYHNDHAFPTGYSHIGIFATDVYAFCERLMRFNVTFVKKPDEGVTKGIAFILDPDGYWIEIMNSYKMTTAD